MFGPPRQFPAAIKKITLPPSRSNLLLFTLLYFPQGLTPVFATLTKNRGGPYGSLSMYTSITFSTSISHSFALRRIPPLSFQWLPHSFALCKGEEVSRFDFRISIFAFPVSSFDFRVLHCLLTSQGDAPPYADTGRCLETSLRIHRFGVFAEAHAGRGSVCESVCPQDRS